MRTDGPTELFHIYNIHNDTAEFEHKIHLQKAPLTLGKNSVSILFTLSQAVQPPNTLSYHIFTVYVCSKPFVVIIITFRLATNEKTNRGADAAVGSRARMKHAEPHARTYTVCYR